MWHWTSAGVDDATLAATGLAQQFGSQADAEAWLTSSFEALTDAGVDAVTLTCDGRIVYGPMSLHA